MTHTVRTVCHTTFIVVQLLFLGPTALVYTSKERCCDEDLQGVENFKIERVIR